MNIIFCDTQIKELILFKKKSQSKKFCTIISVILVKQWCKSAFGSLSHTKNVFRLKNNDVIGYFCIIYCK